MREPCTLNKGGSTSASSLVTNGLGERRLMGIKTLVSTEDSSLRTCQRVRGEDFSKYRRKKHALGFSLY